MDPLPKQPHPHPPSPPNPHTRHPPGRGCQLPLREADSDCHEHRRSGPGSAWSTMREKGPKGGASSAPLPPSPLLPWPATRVQGGSQVGARGQATGVEWGQHVAAWPIHMSPSPHARAPINPSCVGTPEVKSTQAAALLGCMHSRSSSACWSTPPNSLGTHRHCRHPVVGPPQVCLSE